MNCNNCNKEIKDESQNYCVHCGEELKENAKVEVFQNNEDINIKEQLDSSKEFLVKNKKVVSIIAGVIGVIILGIVALNIFSGRAVGEGKIKEDLIGKTMYIGGGEIVLSDDTIKDIEILERDTVKKSIDSVKLKLSLKLEGVELETEYYVNYAYNKEWQFTTGYLGEVLDVNPESKPEDAIKEALKKTTITFSKGGRVKGEVIKDISNITVSGNEIRKEFTGDIVLSNGVATQKCKIEGEVEFSISDLKWNVYSVSITDSEEVRADGDVDEAYLKEVVREILGGSGVGRSYTYEFKSGEYNDTARFVIKKDMISDINIKDTKYLEEDKVIRIELEGTAKGDLIKNLSFGGVILLNSDFGSSLEKDIDVNITAVELEHPTAEKVKELLLDKKIDDTKITTELSNTFVEDKRKTDEVDRVYVNGKINVNGETMNIQVSLYLSMSEGKYTWKVSGVYKEGSFGFKEF